MINSGWPEFTTSRRIALALALFGLIYLLWPTRQNQATLSGWTGRSIAAPGAGVTQAQLIQPLPIQGQAVPLSGRGSGDADLPFGDPLGDAKTILTQGYDVGSHAPAAVWGGVDLAIDGDNDGQADPQGTMGAPIYATHAGIAHVKPDTWPAGNYLAIEGEHYKTAFAHLSAYEVQDGQHVERGQLIGRVGATGQASGPHLHYEVWKDGVNVNPLDYEVIEAGS